jgi:uncharacterized protein
MKLDGARVLLTGAYGGIGTATARAFHARGAVLLLSGRRPEKLDALRAELGGDTQSLPCDLADRPRVVQLAEQAGAVDVLIANAGLSATGWLVDFTEDQIDRALDVNLRSAVQLTRALLPGMLERGRGHLVFVSSLSGKVGSPGSGLYSATKFGLRGFAQALAQDLHGSGVGVSTIFPSFVSDAGLFAESGAKLPRGVATRSPEQVAKAIVRAVERGKLEVDVAPLSLRLGTFFGSMAPRLSGIVQRRSGGIELSEQIARAHEAKR